MSAQPVAFDAEYSPELIRQAARTFRDYLFKRYGPWLVAACIVNAIGLALSLRLGAETGAALTMVVFVVVLGPVWLLYEYFIGPSRYAARLKRVLPASGRMSVGSESVSLVVRGQEAAIPWSMVKVVVETHALFLLVLSPFAFAFVPKTGLPVEAYETLQSYARATS
jgi:YcxB-like protein